MELRRDVTGKREQNGIEKGGERDAKGGRVVREECRFEFLDKSPLSRHVKQ